MGKKGESIVHFVELGLIFDSFQVGEGGGRNPSH